MKNRITLFSILSALAITFGTVALTRFINVSETSKAIDLISADCIGAACTGIIQTPLPTPIVVGDSACELGIPLMNIQSPQGYTFTKSCLQKNGPIYSDDNRFTFFGFPPGYERDYYVKTGNISEKEDRNLNWSVSLVRPAQAYIIFRKIPGQQPPLWIRNQYTKLTNDDYTNLQQFILRKNDQGLIGLYDIYKKNGVSSGAVTFGPASDTNVLAYSMYMVAFKLAPAPTASPSITPAPSRTPSPTPIPTNVVNPPPSGGSSGLPSSILNLSTWKIQMPFYITGSSIDIFQPQLTNYRIDPYFVVDQAGVRFRAPVNGKTTSGSSYPRTELREMSYNASTFKCPTNTNACWSSTLGTHTMTVDLKVTALPNTKPHVVVAQIHDGNDVSVFRLEGTSLYITDGNTSHGHLLDSNVPLGKRFTVKYEISGGVIKYYYNGALVPYTQKKSFTNAYFKTGIYTQANCTNSSPCSATNYGESVLYNVAVTHQ
ncbi:MAG: polysaccharide lyase family 7 protein [bacterium]|nr:polysaccharide lyase family 7 protein [bacterium]